MTSAARARGRRRGHRPRQLADAGVAAQGEGVVVAFDYERGAKAVLPDAAHAAIEEMEHAAA